MTHDANRRSDAIASQTAPPSDRLSDPDGSNDALRGLLRDALAAERQPAPEILAGVQRRLRQRSRGKFYADRWVTERHPPISTYLITSLIMLAALAATYAILHPLLGEAKSVDNQPAPVRVLPPAQGRLPQ